MSESDNNKQSAVIRVFMEAALADPNKKEVQMRVVNGVMEGMAFGMGLYVENKIVQVHEYLNAMTDIGMNRNDAFNEMLASGAIGLTSAMQLRINPKYIDLQPQDIVDMQGYKDIHAAAKEADVAVRVSGLTKEEKVMPQIVLDITKTYEEGREASTYGYPDKPPLLTYEAPYESRAVPFRIPAVRQGPRPPRTFKTG